MKHLLYFETFNKKSVEIGYLKQPVEIRIEIDNSDHAVERKWRHGYDNKITDDDIIETVELAVEQLTIDLMQDKFDIYQEKDDYPTPGVEAGQLNRFVIKNREKNLNLVCVLKPGTWEFNLTVVTVMTKKNFLTYPGQHVINV